MSGEIRIPWFHYFANAAMRVLFPLIVKVHAEGLENTPPTGPLLAAMNHTNFLDPVLVATHIRGDLLPIAKAEVFRFPFNLVFEGYGAFPVRRGEADLAALRHSLKILREGHVMLISPEGTRTKSGTLQSAREGTALIAIKSGAPILPVAVWGNKKLWGNLKRLRRTEVGLRVGEPLGLAPLPAKPPREVLRAITDEIMYYIARLLPPEYRGYYSDVEQWTPRYVLPRQVLASRTVERAQEVVKM